MFECGVTDKQREYECVDASMRGSNSQYHRSHSQCSGADMHARLVLENKIIHENILSLQKQALWVYWGIQF